MERYFVLKQLYTVLLCTTSTPLNCVTLPLNCGGTTAIAPVAVMMRTTTAAAVVDLEGAALVVWMYVYMCRVDL